jgi:hypothetical protein
MTDRRAGPNQGPYVRKEPRSRNDDGRWREKRSDAGKPRSPKPKPNPTVVVPQTLPPLLSLLGG